MEIKSDKEKIIERFIAEFTPIHAMLLVELITQFPNRRILNIKPEGFFYPDHDDIINTLHVIEPFYWEMLNEIVNADYISKGKVKKKSGFCYRINFQKLQKLLEDNNNGYKE